MTIEPMLRLARSPVTKVAPQDIWSRVAQVASQDMRLWVAQVASQLGGGTPRKPFH